MLIFRFLLLCGGPSITFDTCKFKLDLFKGATCKNYSRKRPTTY